ncbi:MAG: tetratricopeptide repeat protein [Phycisphaerae bacterium]
MRAAPKPPGDDRVIRPGGPDATQASTRSRALLAVMLVVVTSIVFFAHRRALTAQALSMNDGDYVLQNYRVQNPSWRHAGLFLAEVTKPAMVEGYYQPLAMISLMLDSVMGGRPDRLMPYHRTSLVLHAANTVLVIILLYLLFHQPVPAVLAGLLFGLHPMTVEVVTWLGERKTPLATFFALISMVLYVRYTRSGRRSTYAACLVTFLLALMSKPTVTPLPVLLLLLDYWPLGRLGWRRVIEKLPFLAIAVASAIITVISQRHVNLTARQGISFEQNLLIVCHNVLFYPLKMIWPANLCPVYPFPDPIDLSNRFVCLGAISTVLLAGFLVISLRWTRALMAGWLFFLVALAPTLLNVGYAMGVAADKYAYLPSVGFLLMLAWLLSRLWNIASAGIGARLCRSAVVLIPLGMAACYVGVTDRYQLKWQDPGTYCENILSIAPKTAWAHQALASHLIDQNRVDDAVEHARQAVELDPENYKVRITYGEALSRQNDTAEAISQFNRALAIKPDSAEAHNGLGMAYGVTGQWQEASRHFEAALESQPHSPEILFNLGTAYLYANQFVKSLTCLSEVSRYRPDNPQVADRLAQTHFAWGQALARENRLNDALLHFEKAVTLRPDEPQAHNALAYAYMGLGQTDEAINAFRKVVALAPKHVDSYCRLAELYLHKGQSELAAEAYQTALHIDPQNTQARAGLETAQKTQPASSRPPG